MVATQSLQNGKLYGKDVQVLLDSGSETSVATASLVDLTKCTQQMVKVNCVHGDVITYPSALVDLKIDGWEREITVALVPDVPVDVVLAWNDHHCPTVELKNIVATRAQRKRRLQEKEQVDEVCEVMLSRVGEDGGKDPIAYASRKPKLKKACYLMFDIQHKNADGRSRRGRDVMELSTSSPGVNTIEH